MVPWNVEEAQARCPHFVFLLERREPKSGTVQIVCPSCEKIMREYRYAPNDTV